MWRKLSVFILQMRVVGVVKEVGPRLVTVRVEEGEETGDTVLVYGRGNQGLVVGQAYSFTNLQVGATAGHVECCGTVRQCRAVPCCAVHSTI